MHFESKTANTSNCQKPM